MCELWERTATSAARTEFVTTQKSSMYEERRRGWQQTWWRRHAAASAVITSEKTAHDGANPDGSATIVK